MNMDVDNELKALLKTREVPRAPADLSAWIIAETLDMEQAKVRAGRLSWFEGARKAWADVTYELFAGVSSPQPAFAMALVLMVGFSVGIYGESFDMLWGDVPGLTTDDLSGFMVIGDSYTAQNF